MMSEEWAPVLTLLVRVAAIVLWLVVVAACVAAIFVVFRLPGYMERQERRLQQIADAAERTAPDPAKVLPRPDTPFKGRTWDELDADRKAFQESLDTEKRKAVDEFVAHEGR